VKIAILGAGAMGSIFGAMLAEGGNQVTLIDVWREAVNAINANGLQVDDKDGKTRTIKLRAVTSPAEAGAQDLVVVFVKAFHTEDAVRSATPLLGASTNILSLQNGWGNAPKIAAIVGSDKVLMGVTYHSATVLGPGHVQHAGWGKTIIGELEASAGARLERVAQAFRAGGMEVETTPHIRKEIWSKLALNVCTLPTAALLRFYAGELVQHDGTLRMMENLLREVVEVANAQEIPLDYNERWSAITGLLERAKGARGSMVQDVENRRRTEIDVINGAVVNAGERLGIPTPYNNTMVWMVKALEETFSNPQ